MASKEHLTQTATRPENIQPNAPAVTQESQNFELSHRNHETITDPATLLKIDKEFLETIEGFHTHEPTREEIESIEEDRKQLVKNLGHLGIHEMIAVMDAYLMSNNPNLKNRLKEMALDTIDSRFPVEDTGHAAFEMANKRSREEWKTALEMAENDKTPDRAPDFGAALIKAAVVVDEKYDNNFDDVIDESNLVVKEQRGKLTDTERQHLDAFRGKHREHDRRAEEEQKLEAIGKIDDENFDDAVPYDPFADDEDDDDDYKIAS